MSRKNIAKKRGIVIITIHQNHEIWNTLIKKTLKLPSMYIDRESCLYVLVKEVSLELNNFLYTGKAEHNEIYALADSEELKIEWEQLGYRCGFHNHRIEYMDKTVTIKCLKVYNPDNGVRISLTPWFIVPGRPYPIFAYIYAIWYYHHHGEKSLNEAARACGKLFKISSFHKSTVSRSIKAMENIIDMSQIGQALMTREKDTPSDTTRTTESSEDVVKRVSEILMNSPSVDAVKERYQNTLKPLAKPINSKKLINRVLSGIPSEHGQILLHPESVVNSRRDTRKRPPRPRKERYNPVQHHFKFVKHARREEIRMAFIEICQHLVLDAAVKYHCFLV